jgi:hypothetical protein
MSEVLESIRSDRNIASINQKQESVRIEKDFVKLSSKPEEAMNDFVPYIIAPIETGWQKPISDNRKLEPGKANIRITPRNAAPIEYEVTILETHDDGKIIKVNDVVKVQNNATDKSDILRIFHLKSYPTTK